MDARHAPRALTALSRRLCTRSDAPLTPAAHASHRRAQVKFFAPWSAPRAVTARARSAEAAGAVATRASVASARLTQRRPHDRAS